MSGRPGTVRVLLIHIQEGNIVSCSSFIQCSEDAGLYVRGNAWAYEDLTRGNGNRALPHPSLRPGEDQAKLLVSNEGYVWEAPGSQVVKLQGIEQPSLLLAHPFDVVEEGAPCLLGARVVTVLVTSEGLIEAAIAAANNGIYDHSASLW